MKYHVWVGMVDTDGKILGSRGLDARVVFPLSTKFWASKRISKQESNINRYKNDYRIFIKHKHKTPYCLPC